MNNGKVCISVCAKTSGEFVEKIKHAAQIADIVEARFDCISGPLPESLFSELRKLSDSLAGKLLVTYRPRTEGGNYDLSPAQRIEFWTNSGVSELADWADLEEDVSEEVLTGSFRNALGSIIKSHHNFVGSPEDIDEVFERLSINEEDISKIAVHADRITDCIPVWRILKTAISAGKRMIPIAMGEAGKWTRILGLAYGSPLAYASLEEGIETAPGQISARDLLDVYRVKDLDTETAIYGIIGNPVSHSL
ncbi:MAG: type I 3-dehydroquinate dehydratase, partial [Acidobacteria bacterium]|nr:type I 3-dehydroquinate dehydratase [Acidobacteriota bacterium]